MSQMLSFKHGMFDCKSENGQERDCLCDPLKALFSSEDLLKVWLQAVRSVLLPARGTDAPAKDLPCCGPLRCSGRYEACGCCVYVCLRKLTVPDVVIHCFIFFIPFRETGFLQETGVFAEDATAVLLMFVNALMDLNASDIIASFFTILYHNIMLFILY